MKKVSSVNSENISKLIYNIKEITSIKNIFITKKFKRRF